MSHPKIWFRTIDHPCASGRQPEPGEKQWNLDWHNEDGLLFRVHVGPESRDLMLRMLDDSAARVFPPKENSDGVA